MFLLFCFFFLFESFRFDSFVIFFTGLDLIQDSSRAAWLKGFILQTSGGQGML